jgi:diguanylate cyclase (GGDEF)-like protein
VLQHLEDVLFESSALGGSVTVMLTDLDDFKVINDSLGHFVGDAALREVAVRMKDGLGPFGMVARLGGDEFVFVGRNVAHMASELGARLARIVAGPLRLEGMTHHLTASVGIAISSETSTPPDMLRDADIAMYRAKATGKGAVEIFGEHCRADARARLDIEQELRRELESPTGAIEVHYQPIVRLHDLSVCGFEALVRWRRGEELVSPAHFVPIAEDTGLIVPLGRYVLADAVTTFTHWIASRPHASTLRLHVNVSARQVASDSLVRDIDRILEMAPLPHGALTLEVTETALLDDRRAARFCRQLRRLGVRVGLDDFGTGYSALSHLRRLELDVVKIDRSFVSGLAVSARDQAIVESTIALAHAVGLSVVAEGVETQAQLDVLQRIGCDAAQGYLLAPPAPADAVTPFLDDLLILASS